MKVSKRIHNIVNEINSRRLCDVGTDHGYIPIYAVYNNIIDKAIACDINKKPLERAYNNIKKYLYDSIIETRLGYGLSKLNIGEVDTISICGMGGYLIIDILEENKNVVQNVNQLLLQPQSGIVEVRKYIHKIGFKIINEKFIEDDNKFYTIINCIKGEDVVYSELDYLLSKILLEKNDKLYLMYLKNEYNKMNNISKSLSNKKLDSNIENLEILKKLNMYKEIFKDDVY